MMQARMVPIGNVFSKFPRMVRDLANQVHKNVNLEIVGETTEIDRTVIELIADPLTHLIRNSIDHGLETPEEREKVGKSREG
nr:chemotaxis protein CheA [Spirochaetota bacterium]